VRAYWIIAALVVTACAAALLGLLWPTESERSVAALVGTVRNDAGVALASATVCATCTSCTAAADSPAACAVTDRNGGYALAELAPGRYRIAAAARGYVAGVSADEGRIMLAPAARSTLDIDLATGGALVTGVVRDATGAPIAGARVRVMRAESPRLVLELSADARGAFEVAMPNGAFQISASAPGYAWTESYGVAPSRRIELALEPAVPLAGKVVHASTGEPIASARVQAIARDRSLRIAWAVTDARGDFAFSELSAGSYLVTASGRGVYGELPHSVELGPDVERAAPLVIHASAALTLEGRVEVAAGAPCAEGYVLLGEPDPAQQPIAGEGDAASEQGVFGPEQHAAIDRDGRVRFEGVPPGRYFASVHCYGNVLESGPVFLALPRDAERELVWTTQPATRLTARAIDRHGRPVAGARIALSWPGRDGRRVLRPAITGADGSVVIESARCGDCQLMPADSAHAANAVTFSISPDGRHGHATLALEGDATLELQVRDHDGAPVDGLQVYARAAGEASGKRVASALGDGRYRIVALPAGAYVVIGDDGVNPAQALWGSDALPIPVESGVTLREQSVLVRDGAFSGRLIDAAGQPVAGAWLTALPDADPASDGLAVLMARRARRVATDRDGRFVLGGLSPSARFKLRAERAHGSAILLEARTPARDLVLALPAPAQVAARALDAGGAPLTQFTVRARSLSTELVVDRLIADQDGRLRWTLPPGPVELTVVAPDGQSGTSRLDLSPGATLDALVRVGG
jgi:hypothetical protein